jgi:hypothetical protein
MNTYVYYFKNDVNCEPIGRVMATSLYEARELVIEIKRLDEQSFDALFTVKILV